MIDHVGIYGSRVAEGLSAFNVGLFVYVLDKIVWWEMFHDRYYNWKCVIMSWFAFWHHHDYILLLWWWLRLLIFSIQSIHWAVCIDSLNMWSEVKKNVSVIFIVKRFGNVLSASFIFLFYFLSFLSVWFICSHVYFPSLLSILFKCLVHLLSCLFSYFAFYPFLSVWFTCSHVYFPILLSILFKCLVHLLSCLFSYFTFYPF